jgi:hypothetical protein
MNHLLSFALCLAGFTALAFAAKRQQRDLFGRPLRPITTYVHRFAGTCALLLALALLVTWQGWSLGLVMFSGHTSMAAAIVFCALIGHARLSARK